MGMVVLVVVVDDEVGSDKGRQWTSIDGRSTYRRSYLI
jgi:hypothetical protein